MSCLQYEQNWSRFKEIMAAEIRVPSSKDKLLDTA